MSPCHLVILSSCHFVTLSSHHISTIFLASTDNIIACDGCDLCFAQAMTSALHVIVFMWSSPCHVAQNIKGMRLDHKAILSYLKAILEPSWDHFGAILGSMCGVLRCPSCMEGLMCGDESTDYVWPQRSDINTITQALLMALLFLSDQSDSISYPIRYRLGGGCTFQRCKHMSRRSFLSDACNAFSHFHQRRRHPGRRP